MLFTRSLSLCKYLSFPAHLHFSFNYVGACALCARYVRYVHGVPVHVEARGV